MYNAVGVYNKSRKSWQPFSSALSLLPRDKKVYSICMYNAKVVGVNNVKGDMSAGEQFHNKNDEEHERRESRLRKLDCRFASL